MINILLKNKHSGVVVSQLKSTANKALKNEVREWVLTVLFIDNSNRRIYSELVKTLENDYIMGQDNYPRDMATAMKLLVNYKPMAKSSVSTSDGITFVTNRRPRTQKEKPRVFDAVYQYTTLPRIHAGKITPTNIMQPKK